MRHPVAVVFIDDVDNVTVELPKNLSNSDLERAIASLIVFSRKRGASVANVLSLSSALTVTGVDDAGPVHVCHS